MSEKNQFTVRRVPRTWTSNKEYEILKGRKVVLKLCNRDEADEVCKYLNSFQTETSTSKKKQSKKKSVKSAKQEKLEDVNEDG